MRADELEGGDEGREVHDRHDDDHGDRHHLEARDPLLRLWRNKGSAKVWFPCESECEGE